MIQNDGQPQLSEDGSVTTPDPSDTHTEDGELTIEKMRRAYSSLQDDYEAGLIVDLIHQRERAAQLALIERLRKHGHGGGNWRRLLDEEARKLKDTTKE